MSESETPSGSKRKLKNNASTAKKQKTAVSPKEQ